MLADELTRLTTETLYLVLLVCAPALGAALVVGVIVATLGALTQVQDAALTFVPRLVAVGLVLAALGGWMGAQVVEFTTELWTAIPTLVS